MNHFQAGQKKALGPPENSLRSLTCRDCIRRNVHWVILVLFLLLTATAGLAVMSDTDNAGGSAAAYIDFIEVYR
jgi:hypothetical protein